MMYRSRDLAVHLGAEGSQQQKGRQRTLPVPCPLPPRRLRKASAAGFTIIEVVVAMMLLLLVLSGLIGGYVQSAYRAEWSGYSLAAQGMAIQQLEQARCATWDVRRIPIRNEITNIATLTSAPLDLPISGTNAIWATNYVSITSIPITNSLNASVYMVKVSTVWPFRWKSNVRYFTNTVADYFAPD